MNRYRPEVIIQELEEIHSSEKSASLRYSEGFSLTRELVYILPEYRKHPEYIKWKKEANLYRRKYKMPDF